MQTPLHMARLDVSYGGDRSLPTHLRKNEKISPRNRYPDVGVPILFYPSVAVPILIPVTVSLTTLGLAGQKNALATLVLGRKRLGPNGPSRMLTP